MKITELIQKLDKIKKESGDVEVCTTGYFGTMEIEEVKVSTWGQHGRYIGENYDTPDNAPLVVFLPANLP